MSPGAGAVRSGRTAARAWAPAALRAAAAVVFALAIPSCVSPGPASAPSADPYVLVLGTAQDGGLPQIGCRKGPCEVARRDPSRARRVASLLIADPRRGQRWLIDATPDLREQAESARPHPAGRPEPGPRPPLFDGIFLTHAHVGHYAGLLWLGREVYGARGLPVYASDRMAAFLRTNGPWSLLVDTGAITLESLRPGAPIALAPDLSVTALPVPHRDEFSDTMAFVVRGPRRSLLYVPDIDQWERWNLALEDVLASVDVALLDGTFFDDREVPGRSLAEIPHPLVIETLRRLEPAPAGQRAKVLFTHLNHTNPIADPASPAAERVRLAGLAVAADGQVIGL